MVIHINEHKRVADILKSARIEPKEGKQPKITQEVLAQRLGKLQSFVSSYEAGQKRVDVLEFIQIALATGSDPAKLFAKLLKPENAVKRGRRR